MTVHVHESLADGQLSVVDSSDQPAAACVVCGNDISAGESVTAHYRGRTLRFKCPGCYARFEADPEPYLGGHQAVAATGITTIRLPASGRETQGASGPDRPASGR